MFVNKTSWTTIINSYLMDTHLMKNSQIPKANNILIWRKMWFSRKINRLKRSMKIWDIRNKKPMSSGDEKMGIRVDNRHKTFRKYFEPELVSSIIYSEVSENFYWIFWNQVYGLIYKMENEIDMIKWNFSMLIYFLLLQ